MFLFLVSRVHWGNPEHYAQVGFGGACKYEAVILLTNLESQSESHRVFSTQAIHLTSVLNLFPYKMLPWMCGCILMSSAWYVILNLLWTLLKWNVFFPWRSGGLMFSGFLPLLPPSFLVMHPLLLSFFLLSLLPSLLHCSCFYHLCSPPPVPFLLAYSNVFGKCAVFLNRK